MVDNLQRWRLSIPSLPVCACHSTHQEGEPFSLAGLVPCLGQENVKKVTRCQFQTYSAKGQAALVPLEANSGKKSNYSETFML